MKNQENNKPILIGIDGNEANINYRVGVNKYAYEILCGIHDLVNKAGGSSKYIIVIVYLNDKPLAEMTNETSHFKYKILKGGKVWILTQLTPHLLLNPEKLNVFFTPSHYVPPISLIPCVCSIMDLGYLEFSAQFRKYDYWQLKWWSAWSINASKCIMAISNATRDDIVRRYPASKDKVVVAYPGYDEELTSVKISESAITALKNRYSIVKDYVLYLGTLKPSKNVEGLIDAWGQIVNNYPDLQLVIGGKKGWLYDAIFAKVAEMGLAGKIIFTDFVPEEDKAALIKGAKIFVF